MTDGVVALARTLDQELVALTRGVSLACPVCSEFVMHVRGRARSLSRERIAKCSSIHAGFELRREDVSRSKKPTSTRSMVAHL